MTIVFDDDKIDLIGCLEQIFLVNFFSHNDKISYTAGTNPTLIPEN